MRKILLPLIFILISFLIYLYGSSKRETISLDNIGFDEQSLPVVICRGMASIPLYFSSYKQGSLLSLEHTHPPASLVVHGNRFGVQRQLKEYWFSQLKKR